jgi:hypothetical protein
MTKHTKSEAARLLQSLRKTKTGGKEGGRPRSCECGECETCQRRIYRQNLKETNSEQAASVLGWQTQTQAGGVQRGSRVHYPTWYVSDLPGHKGTTRIKGSKADWGFTHDRGKAIGLTPYWQRRFLKHCRDVAPSKPFGVEKK